MPPMTSSQKLMVGQFMTLTGVPEKTAAKVSKLPSQIPALESILLTCASEQLLKVAGWKLDQACDR
jgi:hypothetical protein